MTRLLDRRFVAGWRFWLIAVLVAGCAEGWTTTAPPKPQPSTCGQVMTAAPAQSPKGGCSGEPFTPSELRVLLIDRFGPLWYCDRDSYPVGRDEQQAAIEAYSEVTADTELYRAVAASLGIDPAGDHSDAQKLVLYQRWKVAQAIPLEPTGNDRYRFDYLARPAGEVQRGLRTTGVVDARGGLTVDEQAFADGPVCPICLDRATTIDTPSGPVAVDALRLGELVWTLDVQGVRVAGTIIALGSTPAPEGHHVVRLTLADGRSVSASPGHPLADGRIFDGLSMGDGVDGSTVVGLESVSYRGGATFDLVVSGETGTYLAGGIPLRSTLEPGSRR